ncbi:MAG: hypothetical protein JWR62_180 [Modestobacter sp.]|nr:hypothetical protein [Modestobacter sp.]
MREDLPASPVPDWSPAGSDTPAVDTVEPVLLEPGPDPSEAAPVADVSVLAEDGGGTDPSGEPQREDLLLLSAEDGAGPAEQRELPVAGDGEPRPWTEGDVLELREDDHPPPSEGTPDAAAPTWDLAEESSSADAGPPAADAASDGSARAEQPLEDDATDPLIEDTVPPVDDGDRAAMDAVRGDGGAAADLRNVPENAALAEQLSARGLRLGAVEEFDFADNPVLGYRPSGPAEDIGYAVQRWDDTIAPGLATGATREDFAAHDARHGLAGHESLAGVWDYFLGSDAIKSGGVRPNGKLDVTGGRHRLEQARLLGIHHLPFRD